MDCQIFTFSNLVHTIKELRFSNLRRGVSCSNFTCSNNTCLKIAIIFDTCSKIAFIFYTCSKIEDKLARFN